MNILAISGSLRAASLNSALLRATARLAPLNMSIQVFDGLGELAFFNPDIESTHPMPVAKLLTQVAAADALIIASPEYAHGITGVLKNALDWLVSSEAFVNTPIALFNAAPRATHAYAALLEIVTTMSAQVSYESSIILPISGCGLDENGIYNDPNISATLRTALQRLAYAVTASREKEACVTKL